MTPKGAILSRLRRAASVVLPPRALVASVAWSKWYLGEQEMRLLPWLCTKERVGIDIGANAGVYTWHLRRLCREVHAYEPIPELASALRQSLPRCVIHDYALSDEPGHATLHIPVFHGEEFAALGSLSYSFTNAERVRDVEVTVRRLDDEGIRGIGFMKIDAEGHESRVLAGARKVLEEQRPTLQVEIEDRTSPGGIAATAAMLDEYGYDGWYYHHRHLHALPTFSVETLQNPAMMSDDGWAIGPYINNFLFFPRLASWPGQDRAVDKFAAR